jgi:hypothetical protein
MGGFRRALLAIALFGLVGCAPHAATGPAWPKAADSDKDGGESLAPHEAKQVTVAVEKSEAEPKPVVAPAAPVVVPPTEGALAPVIAPSVSAPIEDTITTEDIVIEINDD